MIETIYNIRETFLVIIGYLVPLMLSCGAYVLFISPLLYYRWIIPQIEKRYGRKLIFDPIHRFDTVPITYLELADYITYFSFFRHPPKKYRRYKRALELINYDIKTASKLEVIISISTTVAWYFLLLFLLSGAILIFHDWITGKR